MITTNVGAGNFFVKSKDPSKGWSEPIYLKKIDGIDPSFFFDDNGKGYIVHNGPQCIATWRAPFVIDFRYSNEGKVFFRAFGLRPSFTSQSEFVVTRTN